MSDFKTRITLVNRLSFKGCDKINFIPYLISLNRIIEQVDCDVEVQKVCEHSELKKSRINQLKGLKRPELHDKFVDIITDVTGTNFLIFKN